MLFFGKVRINVSKLSEFSQKLFIGELDRNHIIATYFLKDDPSVGLNIWEALNRDELEKILIPYKPYFYEIIEVSEVVKPLESFNLLMKQAQPD